MTRAREKSRSNGAKIRTDLIKNGKIHGEFTVGKLLFHSISYHWLESADYQAK